eukprot:TRINITY_DN1575_c0_g1_i2.p1 TRINITY_DN1575_c0_g1~~TRINITY_DN1575_c0_g1_i2.p1  ORF type:complete len:515 (+),score=156.89 TRINITY_DN1575_c0_g1_i2:601-2145(+)
MELHGDYFDEVEEVAPFSPLPLPEEAMMHDEEGFHHDGACGNGFEEVRVTRSSLPLPPYCCYATTSGVVAIDECSCGGFGVSFEGDHRHHLGCGDDAGEDGRIGSGRWCEVGRVSSDRFSDDFDLAPMIAIGRRCSFASCGFENMIENVDVGDSGANEGMDEAAAVDVSPRVSEVDESCDHVTCDSPSGVVLHHTASVESPRSVHSVRVVFSYAGGLHMKNVFSLLREPIGSEYRWSTFCPSSFIGKMRHPLSSFSTHTGDGMFHIPPGFDVIVPPIEDGMGTMRDPMHEIVEEGGEIVLCEGEAAEMFLMHASVRTKKCATRCDFPGRMYIPSHYIMHFDALIPAGECDDHDVVACGFILNASTQNVMDDVLSVGRSTTCRMSASRVSLSDSAHDSRHIRLSGEMHMQFCKHSKQCDCNFRLFVPLIERRTSRVLMCFVSPVFGLLARRPDREQHATRFMHEAARIMSSMVHGCEEDVNDEEREICMDYFVQSLVACGEDSTVLRALCASLTD